MRSSGGKRTTVSVIAGGIAMLLLAASLTAQPFYFETSFVAQNPLNGNDIATISAMENAGNLTPLFIDFTSAFGARNIDAVALDACYSLRPPHIVFPSLTNPTTIWSPIYPSGHLAIAKSGGPVGTVPSIDIYQVWNALQNWETYQNTQGALASGQPFARPQTPLWSIPTASGKPVMAMGVANGFFSPTQQSLRLTSYLITAETLNSNDVAVAAYQLTDGFGGLAMPVLSTFRHFDGQQGRALLQGTVLGMAIANGTLQKPWNPRPERTANDIVLIVRDANVNNDIVQHAVRFDLRTASFSALDRATVYNDVGHNQFGYNLTRAIPNNPSTNFQGISIARNPGTMLTTLVTTQTYTHDLAISMADPTFPLTMPGNIHIYRVNSSNPGTGTWSTTTFGGGPICHIPGSDYNVATGVHSGVAFHCLGANLPPQPSPHFQPFGWYIVNPGGWGGGGQFDTISALDAIQNRGTGTPGFYYEYPVGATPGPLVSHPGGLTKVGNPNLKKGLLTVSFYHAGTSNYWIETSEGSIQNGPWLPPNQNPMTVSYQVVGPNHWPLPSGAPTPLPKAPQFWPATSLVAGVTFLSEYGLYIPGY